MEMNVLDWRRRRREGPDCSATQYPIDRKEGVTVFEGHYL
jgi:hypothetical protein